MCCVGVGWDADARSIPRTTCTTRTVALACAAVCLYPAPRSPQVRRRCAAQPCRHYRRPHAAWSDRPRSTLVHASKMCSTAVCAVCIVVCSTNDRAAPMLHCRPGFRAAGSGLEPSSLHTGRGDWMAPRWGRNIRQRNELPAVLLLPSRCAEGGALHALTAPALPPLSIMRIATHLIIRRPPPALMSRVTPTAFMSRVTVRMSDTEHSFVPLRVRIVVGVRSAQLRSASSRRVAG